MSFYFPEIEEKKNVVYDCNKCKLSEKCKSPFQEIYGTDNAQLLIVTNSPGPISDEKKLPLMDKNDKLIRSLLNTYGFSFNKNIKHTYCIKCKITGKNSETFWKCCRSKLVTEINNMKPKTILTFGETATNAVLGLRNKIRISKLRNRIIPSHEFNCVVFPVFHPSEFVYLQEDGSLRYNKAREYALEQDLFRFAKLWNKKLNVRKYVNGLIEERRKLDNLQVKEIKNINDFEEMFKQIYKNKAFAFDYETTNLKPYDKNHDIALISFGFKNYAWWIYISEFEELDYKIKKRLLDLLQNKEILKIIQNKKFEELVSRWFFKDFEYKTDELGNMIYPAFDTMLATHVVDEREGCTSLDFQNLVRFGIHPYNDKVKKYLEIEKKSNDKRNLIYECSKKDLSLYGALDVITTYANYEVLDKTLLNIYPEARWCYNFLMEGHDLFANMTETGVGISFDNLKEITSLLTNTKENINEKIYELPEVKNFVYKKASPVLELVKIEKAEKEQKAKLIKKNTSEKTIRKISL